jgi:tRNA A-37 threonylcarbamoyl transferase component Bud32
MSAISDHRAPVDPAKTASRSRDTCAMANSEPGRLIGRGRHADVFELDAFRVLRRYRTGQQVAAEAAIMEHVRSFGYPVPAVHHANGSEKELERVVGDGLLELLVRRPHRLGYFARLMADLHEPLHEIPAPPDLSSPFGRGDRVLHLDLQPANVILATSGPVVLDWGWAAAGPPEMDVAHTWLQLATSEITGSAAVRVGGSLGRRAFARRFSREFDVDHLRGVMREVAAYRLAARELTEGERQHIPGFLQRLGTGA